MPYIARKLMATHVSQQNEKQVQEPRIDSWKI